MKDSAPSLSAVITSSLEKCFIDSRAADFPELNAISCLKNERVCFTLALTETDPAFGIRRQLRISLRSKLKKFITFSRVESVPCRFPAYPGITARDGNYISDKPGLYPDVLVPSCEGEIVSAPVGQTCSLWFDINSDGSEMPSGPYDIEIILLSEAGEPLKSVSLSLTVIDALLPESDIAVTQWFHCDSLASYYNVKPFSERHWRIIRNYLQTAVKNGINTILTPVFTPPLDTDPKGERMTMQLVGISCPDGEYADKYEFDFTLLERWVGMCEAIGIMHYEISHLFSQWGAYHAPKIIASVTENGKSVKKRIFGWETDAHGERYGIFLRAFLKELLPELEKLKVLSKCIFHISDEPGAAHLESYLASKAQLGGMLDGCKIIDALSDFEFYKSGAVKTPVPSNDHIKPFLDAGVKGLWTYYCCGQSYKVSNRFIAMPSARNRIIGAQMYKYDIAGFLQWGYNFWFTHLSRRPINPYQVTDGDFWVPSGDAFSVYPASDGTAVESIRIAVFQNALQDVRAMKLLEKYIGKAAVVALIEKDAEPVEFDSYPQSASFILAMRERINAAIAEFVHADRI